MFLCRGSVVAAAASHDGENHEEDVDNVQEDGESTADVLVRRDLHALPRHHQLQVVDQVHLCTDNKGSLPNGEPALGILRSGSINQVRPRPGDYTSIL